MKIGIIGLPFSGKTTLFEAITGAHDAAMDRGSLTRLATVPVPDSRMDYLAETGKPKKVTRALIDFMDVAGVGADEDRERSANNLTPVRDADGLVHVVRLFEWASAPPHPRGSLDPQRDMTDMAGELIFADLVVVEKRIERLEKEVMKPTPHQDQDKKELALMKRIRETLDTGQPVRSMELSEQERFMLRAFTLLSEKPLIAVLNVHEDELDSDKVRQAAEALGPDTVVISARIEKEIAELDEEERALFIEEMGLGEPASLRVIRACYEKLGLRSFFTGTGEGEELRAWTFQAGDNALVAAGKIHSDIQRGFIRAEVISYEDMVACGSLKKAQAEKKTRLEGKEYIVRDGDVITFRFKV